MVTFLRDQPRTGWFAPLTTRDRLLIAYLVGAFAEFTNEVLRDIGMLTGWRYPCLFAALVFFVVGALVAMREPRR